MKNNKVVVVNTVDEDEVPSVQEYLDPENGIVSCKFVLFEEMDDDMLGMFYEADPELIATKRPDFIKRRYPTAIN